MFERDCGAHLALDTNCINAQGRHSDLNQLDRWYMNEVITVIIPEDALDEMKCGGGGHQRFLKAIEHPISTTFKANPGAPELWRELEAAIFHDGAKTPQERDDVTIALNAENMGAILVTMDGDSKRQPRGILGSKEALAKLGLRVMRPSEAVECVRKQIHYRDKWIKHQAEQEGLPLPEWVGKD